MGRAPPARTGRWADFEISEDPNANSGDNGIESAKTDAQYYDIPKCKFKSVSEYRNERGDEHT